MAQSDMTQDLKDREAAVQRAGREARRAGQTIDANPHAKGELQHFHWATGWVAEDMLMAEGVDAEADFTLVAEPTAPRQVLWRGMPIEALSRDQLVEALRQSTVMLHDGILSRRRLEHARRQEVDGLFTVRA